MDSKFKTAMFDSKEWKAPAAGERMTIRVPSLPPWASDNWRWLAARLDNIDSKLASLQATLTSLQKQEVLTMSAMDDAIHELTVQTHANLDVEQAGVEAIQHLADLLSQAATTGDPQAVLDLAVFGQGESRRSRCGHRQHRPERTGTGTGTGTGDNGVSAR